MKKAIALAFALTSASVISQMARGQDVLETPNFHDSHQSDIKFSQPLLMQQSNGSEGVTATLIVDCNTPKTYLTLKGENGGTDIYTFNNEGVPTVDATPPTGASPPPDIKKSLIQKDDAGIRATADRRFFAKQFLRLDGNEYGLTPAGIDRRDHFRNVQNLIHG